MNRSKKKIRKIYSLIKWDLVKAVLRGKYKALGAYVTKLEPGVLDHTFFPALEGQSRSISVKLIPPYTASSKSTRTTERECQENKKKVKERRKGKEGKGIG